MSEQENPPEESVSLASPATSKVPARLSDALPNKLLLLPLAARPFFPAQTMPIVIPEEPWRETIERVGNTPHHLLGLVYAPMQEGAEPQADHLSHVGTVVRMHQPMRADGKIQFIDKGVVPKSHGDDAAKRLADLKVEPTPP